MQPRSRRYPRLQINRDLAAPLPASAHAVRLSVGQAVFVTMKNGYVPGMVNKLPPEDKIDFGLPADKVRVYVPSQGIFNFPRSRVHDRRPE